MVIFCPVNKLPAVFTILRHVYQTSTNRLVSIVAPREQSFVSPSHAFYTLYYEGQEEKLSKHFTFHSSDVGKTNKFVLGFYNSPQYSDIQFKVSFFKIMFPCPVCKEQILFTLFLSVSSHIRLHITQGTSFYFPIVCFKGNCGAICSSLKTFAQHVKHQHAIDFFNDSQSLDTPILFDEANDFPTSFSNNLKLDTNNQCLSRVSTSIDNESLVDEILLKL